MISVEEALEKILSYINVLEVETKPILECDGLVLAEDIRAYINIPPLDNSAMDGYAVRAEDTLGTNIQSPRVLKVIGMVVAGAIPKYEVIHGTAVRIMTGAPIPKGANSVARFEDTDEPKRKKDSRKIGILCEVKAGLNIRLAGEDIANGSPVLAKGTVLKPAHIGLLASLGRAKVSVIRRPRVAILATGNELVEINKTLPPGKLYNSNSYSMAAEVLHYGGIPIVLGIALDRKYSLTTKLRQGLKADMLITTGGVSLGDFDLVKDMLEKEGQISFWKVRMKPGKPMAFGAFRSGNRNIPHLGLPGNPVSAMVTFELFVRPAILKFLGKTKFDIPTIDAVLEDTIINEDGRRIFARAVVEKRNGSYFARTTGPQGSGILTSMSLANGLVVVPENKPAVKPGDRVKVMMLNWSGEEF
jgi:molybdopterin molybdotransferase